MHEVSHRTGGWAGGVRAALEISIGNELRVYTPLSLVVHPVDAWLTWHVNWTRTALFSGLRFFGQLRETREAGDSGMRWASVACNEQLVGGRGASLVSGQSG